MEEKIRILMQSWVKRQNFHKAITADVVNASVKEA